MPDLVGPKVSVPAVVVHPTNGQALHYVAFADSLTAVWGFYDLESGIRQIRATVATGSTPPPVDSLELEFPLDPTQRHGVLDLSQLSTEVAHGGYYWLHVCAQDYMDHTVCSPPWDVTVDLTPPVCATPEDVLPLFISSKAGVSSRWSCVDPESGVLFTEWIPYIDLNGTTQSLLYKPILHKAASSSGSVATPMLQVPLPPHSQPLIAARAW